MEKNTNAFLGEEPIGKLMMTYAVPSIFSLLVSSLYNIVDQIFIGRGVGYLGNGATNVVFPITVIALAISLMVGDGCAAYLSICQGKKDSRASKTGTGNAICFLLVSSIVIMLLLIVAREGVLGAFGATENNIEYARQYFDIIVLGLPFYMFASGLCSIIRADGSPSYAMMSTIVGCVINIILDPIAIFVLGMGVKGAAGATVIGEIASAVIVLYYLLRRAKTFRLDAGSFLIRASFFKNVLPLGTSSFLSQISIVAVMGVMNNALIKYGALSKYGEDIPLTVFGIVMKVFQIVIAFAIGLAAGSQPIIGFNYGAGLIGRVKETYRKMVLAEIVIGVIATILFEFFPLQIISLFGSESDLYNEFAVKTFRIYLCSIVLCCIIKATGVFVQSLGKPFLSMILSLLREFVLIAPLALILPVWFGVTGCLLTAPVADVILIFVVIIIVAKLMKEMDLEKGA